MDLKEVLIDHEGIRSLPYFDCCGLFFRLCTCRPQGKLTIGVGRNLEQVGISENEAMGLLDNDLNRVFVQIEKSFPWFEKLNPPRQIVIQSMVFNMGIEKFKEFKKMIACLEKGQYSDASKQMLNSLWASQVKLRAIRLSDIMDRGTL